MFNYKINKNINLCNQTTEQVKQKTENYNWTKKFE